MVEVSDGSFKVKLSTVCWIMDDKDGIERIVGLVEVHGYDDKHGAYRSELAGLFGQMVVVNILQKVGDVNDGDVEIGCGELSTLQRNFWNGEEDISSGQPNLDILSGLHRHIAGYQEDAEGGILNRWSLLNIECDIGSKGYWSVLKRGGYRK